MVCFSITSDTDDDGGDGNDDGGDGDVDSVSDNMYGMFFGYFKMTHVEFSFSWTSVKKEKAVS